MRYIILLTLFVTACGDLETKEEKSLFSVWTSGESTLDLTGASFAPTPITIPYATNAGCNCTIEFIGSESSGVAYLSSCTHYGPTNYCTSGTIQYDYTNSFGYLRVCGISSCEVYQ